jgi:hypothetical protein
MEEPKSTDTMALLNDMINGAPRILDGANYLRCFEENASGGRVCVGNFNAGGLKVRRVPGDDHGFVDSNIGRALARKL